MNYDEIFDTEGMIGCLLDDYHPREGQINMAKTVHHFFNDDCNVIIEAHTGIGKSFAYLIPAIYFSAKTGNKVVICTSNKTLQKQLFEKDLPFLQDALTDVDFTFAMVKGRSNYICNKYFKENKSSGKYLSGKHQKDFKRLEKWFFSTEKGEWDEISNLPLELISDHTVDDGDCTGRKCPLYDECFSKRARDKAKKANIIVVNYHLLLLDQKLKVDHDMEILPQYKYVVFDEAHKLIESTREQFGDSLGSLTLKKSLRGLKRSIEIITEEKWKSKAFGKSHKKTFLEFLSMLDDYKEEVDLFSKYMMMFTKKKCYTDLPLINHNLDGIFKYPSDLIKHLNKIIDFVSDVCSDMKDLYEELKSKHQSTAKLGDVIKSLEKYLDSSDDIMGRIKYIFDKLIENEKWAEEEFCAHLVAHHSHHNASIKKIPIKIDGILNKYVWSQMKACVLCSATLRTGGNCDYFKSTIGINPMDYLFQSPFDLKNQMKAIVDSTIPEPSNFNKTKRPKEYEEYIESHVEKLKMLNEQLGGGILVLTTSNQFVKDIHESLSKKVDVNVFSQLDYPSAYMAINDFKTDEDSCLVGTMSLWEGVDVPGDALRCVYIMKLPFKHVTDPLSLIMQHRGQEWFRSYAVPNAIMYFNQGIGRLIRKEMDKGVIYMGDSRLFTKGYGKSFLSYFYDHGIPIEEQIMVAK